MHRNPWKHLLALVVVLGACAPEVVDDDGYCACDCPAGPLPPAETSTFCDAAPAGARCCIWLHHDTLLVGACEAGACIYTETP